MSIPELDILKPIDPSITNSDDYEIFTLSNATVAYSRNGKPASLLSAFADTQLRVEGRLEKPSGAQMKCLVNRPYKPVDIVIRGVTRYSYGQTTDGEMMIWALGSAGWFEIRPSRAYKDIYEDMVKAVEILYFVTDIYNEPRPRGGGPSAELIFREYAEDERFACETTEEAEALFHKFRPFLIMCFLTKAQGLGWSNTPLYQFFKRKFPKEFDTARARIEGKLESGAEKPSKPEPAAAPKPKGKTNEKDMLKARPVETPKKDDNWWEAATLFEFMQKAVNQSAIRKGNITIERVAKLLIKRYELDEVEMAKHFILVHSQNLCYMMEYPRRKNIAYFVDEPIYTELSSEHGLSAAEVRRAGSIDLRPRKDHGRLKDDVSSSEDESSDELATTPQRRPPRSRRGRLSVLRPKSGKYSGKGKGVKVGKGKGKKNVNIPMDDESGEDSDMSIDTPTQALSPGKRKHVDDSSRTRPRKRTHSESESSDSTPSSPASSPPADASAPPLPLRWRDKNSTNKSNAHLPPVISTPLPTHAANGPGDSWICTFDGCSQKFYGASTEVGTELINEHLKDHSRGRAFEIGLVLREEQKLRLPVSNLIKRIREMAERQQPLFPTGAPIQPTPIERAV